ncbi:MAG: ankyrin repeat domain-containing protein, partial [Gammaproteobacteria bacterium]|nr:ankyrin repeat domain-containing protein [Gammaproteobacteria bacterium]
MLRTIILFLLLNLGVVACTGNNFTELQLSAARGQTDRVATMLNRGVDIDQLTKYGKTALMLAAENGHVDTVQLLLSRNAYKDAQDIDGMTAMMFAG